MVSGMWGLEVAGLGCKAGGFPGPYNPEDSVMAPSQDWRP